MNINVDMITWAIARAGHDLQEFLATNPRIADWISQKRKPTLRQLEKFSHKVHLPFGYLFLKDPPKESLPIPFFRTSSNESHDVSLNVFDTILLMQRRQEWLREYLKDNDVSPISFVGKYSQHSSSEEVVRDIRKVLNLEGLWARHQPTWEKAIDYLVARIEEVGIIVVFNSVVENNTSRSIGVDDCRGFVLVDDYCPFMFVNSADAKAAQMFTIVHELAHVWTGQSAGFDFRQLQPADQKIEHLCDKVAAELLVPAEFFLTEWNKNSSFDMLARNFKVSPIVIARRALDLEVISRDDFFQFYNEYIKRFKEKKEDQSGGGDFYATAKKRVSLTFASHVNRAVHTNKLLYRDANKLLGLKGDTYAKFISKHF